MYICQNNSQLHDCDLESSENPKSILFNVGKKSMRRQKPFKYWYKMEAIKQSPSYQGEAEDKIKCSGQYKKMMKQISELERLRMQEAKVHDQRLSQVNSLIEQQRERVYNLKVNLWELRNQMMGLQQVLDSQIYYENELKRDLGQSDEGENQCEEIKLNEMFSSEISSENKQQCNFELLSAQQPEFI